jgi:glycopeptide antibiotics resistance protein
VLLFWVGPGVYSSRCFQQVRNLGQPLLFAILTYPALKWPESFSSWPLLRQVVALFTAVFLVSLPIEFLQMVLDFRSPDVFDILRNISGTLFAVVFFLPHERKSTSRYCA